MLLSPTGCIALGLRLALVLFVLVLDLRLLLDLVIFGNDTYLIHLSFVCFSQIYHGTKMFP